MSSRSAELLANATLAMTAAWNRTAAVWRDETARRFANEFWSPTLDAMRRYQTTVERLERALHAAESIGAE
jgi:hypothetical protein